jgi:hypothetical protein
MVIAKRRAFKSKVQCGAFLEWRDSYQGMPSGIPDLQAQQDGFSLCVELVGRQKKRPRGPKPSEICDALRGAEAPLFHVTAGVRESFLKCLGRNEKPEGGSRNRTRNQN